MGKDAWVAGADRREAPGPKPVRLGRRLRLRRQPPGSWQLWNGGVQRGVSSFWCFSITAGFLPFGLLATDYWPLFTCHAPRRHPLGPAGSGRAQTLRRWLLPATDRPIAKKRTGPISTSESSISVCHRTRRFLRTKQFVPPQCRLCGQRGNCENAGM